MKTAYFNRFSLDLPDECVQACSHSGPCDSDVSHWASRIDRPAMLTPELVRAELHEYGAWDADELTDDSQNWQRLLWIASGNIRDEARERDNELPSSHA